MSVSNGNGTVKNACAKGARRQTAPKTPPELSSLPPVRQALYFLQALAANCLIELRLLDCPTEYGRPFVMSGYYNDLGSAAHEIVEADQDYRPCGAYVTLNPVLPSLLARSANELRRTPKCTTNASEIVCRRRLLIDLDPIRAREISSSDTELAAAIALGDKIRVELKSGFGWPDPILITVSGNGVHLVYGIDLPNDVDSTSLVAKVLKGLGNTFNTDAVRVDESVCDAARILKVPGTTARKGSDIAERPHRRVELRFVSKEPKNVSRSMLENVAAPADDAKAGGLPGGRMKPSPRRESQQSNNCSGLDVPSYLRFRGVKCSEIPGLDDKGRRRWALTECPFHPDHGGHDTVVFQTADGVTGFHCFHDRCAQKTWKDVVAKIGAPGNYDTAMEQRTLRNFRFIASGNSDEHTARALALTSEQIAADLLSAIVLPAAGQDEHHRPVARPKDPIKGLFVDRTRPW